ncbi:surfeit locus protein 2 isoform X2 [Sceloporus undulatus]|uniref:surfeit locus protein 2 isoform X2 n=1 Tax=Sceloporus undulatus TaxID=8520 RepID=UPI001C4C20FB|nr:surfeit locus protein 2 isoform X2 [Sceloporus undulatus]
MEEAGSEEAEELRRFLEQHPALRILPPGTRVRCALTGHELPCRLPALQAYTAGKKYQRLSAVGLPSQGDGEAKEGSSGGDGNGGLFGPHLVPSTRNPQQLFCRLTLRHINRIPAHVLRHVQGRRFQKALRNYEKCQREGVEYVPSCCRRRQKQPQKTPSEGPQHPHPPRRKGGFWEPPASDDSGSDTEDSMSDLYPPELFQEKSLAGKESNHDFATDSDEEVAMPTTQNGCEDNSEASGTDPQMGTKRGKQGGGLKKRFKSRNKKPKRFGKAVGGK